MTGTALEHSQIIITKLLEVLINENRLNFKVTEVEGDAVLFYWEDAAPSFADVLSQSKTMFMAFHRHLKMMESQSTCNCQTCPMSALPWVFGDDTTVTPDKFCKVEDQSDVWEKANRLGVEIAEKTKHWVLM